MGEALYTIISQVRTVAGPCLTLLYPLYASIEAMESITKHDNEQWLAYWIIYSFLALIEIIIQPALETMSIWYDAKLVFVGWLVLPQFKGAAVLYKKFVREQIKKYNSKHGGRNLFQGRSKFMDFMHHKKEEVQGRGLRSGSKPVAIQSESGSGSRSVATIGAGDWVLCFYPTFGQGQALRSEPKVKVGVRARVWDRVRSRGWRLGLEFGVEVKVNVWVEVRLWSRLRSGSQLRF
ncbi:hypothetical protein F8388_007594, partial [Cannabis sativa]